MSTFYLDFEGGNDANDGTSFANRWKTFNSGATAARTAPGDTIRVMASPDPTSMAINGTWTDGPLQTAYNIVSSTNATPIVITISSGNYTSMAPAVGDTMIVNGHTTNTKANGVWKISAVNGTTDITIVNADGTNSAGNGVGGASGTVLKASNMAVILASAVTQAIACVGNQGTKTNWTASANVTCQVLTSDFKEGGECQEIAVAAGFTTGLAAYFATGLLDLSGYQQVTFWIKQTAGTVGAASAISLKLCTDTIGAVGVNTINIPALSTTTGNWFPVTVDTAGNLSNLIASVAFYVNTDNGAQTFQVDCITACKASSNAASLTIGSLIGKNSGTEAWYPIQSINNVRVMLDQGGTNNGIKPASAPQRGYAGTTETVTAYKRQQIVPATAIGNQTIQEPGTAGNLINYEGGYDRTAMTTQSGFTWFDASFITNTAFLTGTGLIRLNNFGIGRSSQSGFILANNNNCNHGTLAACGCASNGGFSANGGATGTVIDSLSAVANIGVGTFAQAMHINTITRASSNLAGITLSTSSSVGTITQANNNAGAGVTLTTQASVGTITAANGNGTSGLVAGQNCSVTSLTATSNTQYGIDVTTAIGSLVLGGASTTNLLGGIHVTTGSLTLRNFVVNEATEVTGQTASFSNSRVYSEKHDGTANNHQIFTDGGLISSETGTVHGAATIAWQFAVTSTNRSQYYPLFLSIAKIAVAASALVTVTAWMRRDNTGLTMQLICKGGQLNGVASDVVSAMTASANTWEQITITFTPTEVGVIEIEAQAWGGSTYNGYVSDMDISQA